MYSYMKRFFKAAVQKQGGAGRMQAIRNKIRSRRGASLTFALLLFLVCAVVGSVVLVAGTAASGRMSQIAEMDQRYYSVNSAARLLIDTIDGKEVTIIETKPEDASASYAFGDGTKVDEALPIAKEAALFYIQNNNTIQRKRINEENDNRLPLTLTVSGKDRLTVNIKEEIDGSARDTDGSFLNENGAMILTVEQQENKADKKSYAMNLLFNADEKHFVEVKRDGSGMVTETATTFKVTWHIQDIRIVGAGRLQSGDNNEP